MEVIDERREGHEPIRIRPVVFRAGQLNGPVGSDQAEGVPAPGTPGLGHAAGLKHDMVDLGLGQVPARCQSGLPGADDGHVHVSLHPGRNLNSG